MSELTYVNTFSTLNSYLGRLMGLRYPNPAFVYKAHSDGVSVILPTAYTTTGTDYHNLELRLYGALSLSGTAIFGVVTGYSLYASNRGYLATVSGASFNAYQISQLLTMHASSPVEASQQLRDLLQGDITNVTVTNADDRISLGKEYNTLQYVSLLDGNDFLTIYGSLSTDLTIDGGEGRDHVKIAPSDGGRVVIDLNSGTGRTTNNKVTLKNIESIVSGDNNDRLTGDEFDNTLSGGAGNDKIWGGAGDDKIFASIGNNKVWAGSGDDLIYASDETKTFGQRGSDTIFIYGAGGVVKGGRGRDTIVAVSGDVNKILDLRIGQITEDGKVVAEFKSIENAGGGRTDDVLHGNGRSNTLNGGRGNDTVFGHRGNDVLSGDGGGDLLIGGKGSDVFVFENQVIGHDTVKDFETGIDTVLLGEGSNVSRFGAFKSALTEVGKDVVFEIDEYNSITFKNLQISDFSRTDIEFA